MVDKRKSPTSDSEASDSGSGDDLEATPSGPGPLVSLDAPSDGFNCVTQLSTRFSVAEKG